MMVFEGVRRSMIGLGFSAIFVFSFLTYFTMSGLDISTSVIWKNMLGSILMGIYFGSASLLFEIEEWSPLKQTSIHFILSISIWLPLSIIIGWVPFEVLPILIGITVFVITYIIFWIGTRFYLIKLEKEMNSTIRK
ncbi:DUF3021 domain-containing protein [Evansella sp. AB-P1]|uniref:DUF3021 domain-containing protein n=1 Tax=Evansella sp. AB-P1 TaxID=3037653 RepID=UPI00241E4F6B|nr:DUF3021 domain-containing protein [Evansella sp. AB-P1]MDG5788534.1 DUF3021 domain-containing protein [Evansella sp. AB-P1]